MKPGTAIFCGILVFAPFLIGDTALIGDTVYRRPPGEVARMVEAPPLPSVTVDPTRSVMLLVERAGLPPISDLARPMWRLAGLRIDPGTNGRHGPRRYVGLTLKAMADGSERRVELPPEANIGFPSWSPDGKHFAFTLTTDDAVELWVAETAGGSARKLLTDRLQAAMSSSFRWMPDSRRLLSRLVPRDRGPAPKKPAVPSGPVIRETSRGRKSPVRTYQDLLKSPHDEALFDHVLTSQLALVDCITGEKTLLGKPALYSGADPSPGGKHILVTRMVRPYSYLVPAWRFPDVVEIWDEQGQVIREMVRRPLKDGVPIGGVSTGPRSFGWCSTRPATLYWVEALDGGDPKTKVPHRDRLLVLSAPFRDEPEEVFDMQHRYQSLRWLETGAGLLGEYDRDRRWIRSWLVEIDRGAEKPRLIWDRSRNDRYGDPGQPVMTTRENGERVILVHEGAIYLSGRGAGPGGEQPFLDRMELTTLRTERLWQCQGESYESVEALLSRDGSRILTRYETPASPPNYYERDLPKGSRRQLTHFRDPAPEFAGVTKQLVTYEREDGVQLSATLYLPPGHQKGDRHPLIVWAYPREYNDPATAGQVSGSPHRFTRPRGSSHLFLLMAGYAIMDGAGMPVIGHPETANNTFVEQIVMGASAAIDHAVTMGVADRERVGIGGHSYGAFMTANLLAHSDLFRAGIARSGAYNRTLTPFGFQNERRTFWEAPEIYFAMSPFMHAEKINEPVLLIHGQVDNNSGTFPIQSERVYHAIKGHGGTARLVMLPHESHGYLARESILHTLAEMIEWLDRHVKNGGNARKTVK